MTEARNKRPASKQNVAFADFWLMVAHEVGDARLHLDENARTLDEFIHERSDVREYLHCAIRDCYKSSACQNLRSPICLESVLDVLGTTAWKLQKEAHGDLFDIELLEEIAWLICDRYASQITELVARSAAWQPDADTRPAQIVSFPDYKIRRKNATQ